MKTKMSPAGGFKALDEAAGTFEALVARFGNVDRAGDRIVKGAFADSLKAWESRGRPVPVIFSHQWDDLDAHIGRVIEAKETDEGLYVQGQLDMDEPYAARVFKKMQEGTLVEFSFAYDVIDAKRQNGAFELLKLDLLEVGPTLVGMNSETQLLGVKEGRELSDKNLSKIQAIHDAVCELGAKCAGATEEAEPPAKDEEPEGAKSEERRRTYAERVAAELALLELEVA